jgi:hypothetical protein
MKKTVCVVLLSLFWVVQAALAQESILETYTLGQGGTASSSLEGLTAQLQDQGFGGVPGLGTAQSSIRFETRADGSSLSLLVYRDLPPGTIAFALLVNSVEVRAFDLQGQQVYARTLEGFVFGDGASGLWLQILTGLPPQVAQLHLTFFGNYE